MDASLLPPDRWRHPGNLLVGLVALMVLFSIAFVNFILFHSLAEGLSIVVGASIFLIVWNTQRHVDRGYLQVLCVAYLFVAICDGLHTLAYPGMMVFPDATDNLAPQLWIGARYMEAISLLALPLVARRRLNFVTIFVVYLAITTLLLCTIFLWQIFPDCYINGRQTTFKLTSEYVIMGLLGLSIVGIRRLELHGQTRRLLTVAVALTIVSEFTFTFYTDPYSIYNALGHVLKVASFYFIYLALVERALRYPFEVLFHNLQSNEQKYRALFETMSEGFALHEIMEDEEGRAYDYRFLEVNPGFETLTGLKREQVLGKSVREVLPVLEPVWLETYLRVAATGEPEHLEEYSAALGKFYSVAVYSPAPKQFAVIFSDISALKAQQLSLHEEIRSRQAAEAELREFNERLEERVRERTALAEHRAKQLQHLAVALTTAEEAERHRLAELLHDDLQQTLAAIKYRLVSLRSHLAPAGSDGEELMEAAHALIDQSIQQSRSLSHELSPYVLRSGNLERILTYACAEAKEKHGLQINLRLQDAPEKAGEAECGLVLRTVRELLFNVVKHANTREAEVELSMVDGQARIVVADDGDGFTPDLLQQSRSSGMGLATIAERLELIGGHLTIDSAPGRGTRIVLQVPITPLPAPTP